MKRATNESPDFAARFKLALAAVIIGLIVVALGSPVDWTPVATPPDAPAIGDSPATSSVHESMPSADAAADAHVQAF
jgi:hypothetical protein